jgi:hypothetical protein
MYKLLLTLISFALWLQCCVRVRECALGGGVHMILKNKQRLSRLTAYVKKFCNGGAVFCVM